MKIAIVGSSNGPNSFGVGKSYTELALYLSELKGDRDMDLTIVNPWSSNKTHNRLSRELDLLILPGGADLSPHFYGEQPHPMTGNGDVAKEAFFRTRLSTYINNGCPIFGICLGFQMLNVYFGGKLRQHLRSSFLHQSDRRYTAAHEVIDLEADKDSERRKFEVNSHHHQAVTSDILGDGLVPRIISMEWDKKIPAGGASLGDDYTLIEGFYHKDLPISGVQWHPEEWFDYYSISEMLRISSFRESSVKLKR